MKVNVVCVAVALLLGSWIMASSERLPQAQQIPAKIGVIYYLHPAQNQLVPLAKEVAVTKNRAKALGFGGSASQAELKGAHSTVKLSAVQMYEFFIRGADPTRFKLYRFEVKDKQRHLLMYSAGAMNIRGQSVMHESEIPISITECGESCYKLVPTVALGEGEYGFSPIDNNDTFSFGVAAGSSSKTSIGDAKTGAPLTNENIIALKKAGISDDVIIAKIKTSPGKYKLDTNDIVAFKNQGVSESVILAMIDAAKIR